MATFAEPFLKLTLFDKTIFDGSVRFSSALALLNTVQQPIQGRSINGRTRHSHHVWLPSHKKGPGCPEPLRLLVMQRS
jgi:hypothetical protein